MNHYLVSFLGRIAGEREGLNLEPMLYQVRMRHPAVDSTHDHV